jgi:hypothetical protein
MEPKETALVSADDSSLTQGEEVSARGVKGKDNLGGFCGVRE